MVILEAIELKKQYTMGAHSVQALAGVDFKGSIDFERLC